MNPIAYLVRVGSVDNRYPLLSDPSLSQSGIEQAGIVREFFLASGIGPVRATTTAAGMEFAQLISEGFIPRSDLPEVIICDSYIMNMVHPGGIIAVYPDQPEYRHVPILLPVSPEEHN